MLAVPDTLFVVIFLVKLLMLWMRTVSAVENVSAPSPDNVGMLGKSTVVFTNAVDMETVEKTYVCLVT
jgi:hypothetical protein